MRVTVQYAIIWRKVFKIIYSLTNDVMCSEHLLCTGAK